MITTVLHLLAKVFDSITILFKFVNVKLLFLFNCLISDSFDYICVSS